MVSSFQHCLSLNFSIVSHILNSFPIDNDEEGGAGGSSDAVSVVDIVDAFGLQEITLSKGEFMAYVKAFLPKVKKFLEEQGKSERIPVFQKGATAFVKHLIEKFDEVQIYTGKEFNTDGAYAYCYYVNQEDAGPTFFYFIDGLKEEKF